MWYRNDNDVIDGRIIGKMDMVMVAQGWVKWKSHMYIGGYSGVVKGMVVEMIWGKWIWRQCGWRRGWWIDDIYDSVGIACI